MNKIKNNNVNVCKLKDVVLKKNSIYIIIKMF